jgi:hypothetical protein
MLTICTSMGLDKLRTNVRNSFQPFIDRWDLTLPRVAALPNGYKRVLTHFHCALLLSPCPFSPPAPSLPFPFVLFAPLFSVAQLLSSHASGCNKQTVRPPSQASARIHRPPLLRGHLHSRAGTRPTGSGLPSADTSDWNRLCHGHASLATPARGLCGRRSGVSGRRRVASS